MRAALQRAAAGLETLDPEVSEGLARVVEPALSKQPEDRFVDAGAMLPPPRGPASWRAG